MNTISTKLIHLSLIFLCLAGLSSCAERYTPQKDLNAEYKVFIESAKTRSKIAAFRRFLEKKGLADVVEFEQLMRQGTDWRKIKEPAYALPPRKYWHNILPSLVLLKKEIIPVLGELEVLSGFRTSRYNRLAKGARGSKHLVFAALDVVPKNNITRKELHQQLLKVWKNSGRPYKFGLGLYSRVRFHIDTVRYRKW